MTRVFYGKETFRDEELSGLWGKRKLLDHSLSELFTIGCPQGCYDLFRNWAEERL